MRDRVLTEDKLRDIWEGFDALRSEVALTCRCAILFGRQRFRQLLRAEWKDYGTAAGTLTLLDPKGRSKAPVPHLLTVSPRVASMLAQLRAFNGRGSCIFSASGGRAPIHTATLSIAFASLRGKRLAGKAAAATPMKGLDLRRNVKTRLQALGVNREVRTQLMSHGRTAGIQQGHC